MPVSRHDIHCSNSGYTVPAGYFTQIQLRFLNISNPLGVTHERVHQLDILNATNNLVRNKLAMTTTSLRHNHPTIKDTYFWAYRLQCLFNSVFLYGTLGKEPLQRGLSLLKCSTLHIKSYVFIEGTDGVFFQRIEILEWASGEPHHQVQVIQTSGHDVKVVTDWDGGGLVHTLIQRVLQIWDLKGVKN